MADNLAYEAVISQLWIESQARSRRSLPKRRWTRSRTIGHCLVVVTVAGSGRSYHLGDLMWHQCTAGMTVVALVFFVAILWQHYGPAGWRVHTDALVEGLVCGPCAAVVSTQASLTSPRDAEIEALRAEVAWLRSVAHGGAASPPKGVPPLPPRSMAPEPIEPVMLHRPWTRCGPSLRTPRVMDIRRR